MPFGYDFTPLSLATLVTGKAAKAIQILAAYQNAIAIAEGAPGAPRVVRGALSTITNSVSGSLGEGASATISLGGGAFFPNFSTSSVPGIQLRTAPAVSTNPDNARVELHQPTSESGTRSYVVSWRRIITT